MTEKTLRTLLRKKTLTSAERVHVLREAHRLLNRSISCFYVLQDACDMAAEAIAKPAGNRADRLTAADEKRMDRFEDTRDEFEDLIELLDNAAIPDLSEVR